MGFFTFDKFTFNFNKNFGIVAMNMLVFSMMVLGTTLMDMYDHT